MKKTIDAGANKDTRANRKEPFVVKICFYTIMFISFLVFVLLISSITSLHSAWKIIGGQVIEAWMMVRIPLISTIVCLSWFGIIALFVRVLKEWK